MPIAGLDWFNFQRYKMSKQIVSEIPIFTQDQFNAELKAMRGQPGFESAFIKRAKIVTDSGAI